MYNNLAGFYQSILLVTKMQSLHFLLQAEVNPLYSLNPEKILKAFFNKTKQISASKLLHKIAFIHKIFH